MFSLVNLVKYLTLLTYIGFFISSISGFYNVSKEFELCNLMNSIILFFNLPVVVYFEIINENNDSIQLIHYARSYLLLICSLMIFGLSSIGIGFGIYGIIISIVNFFMGLFDIRDNSINPIINNNSDNEDEEHV